MAEVHVIGTLLGASGFPSSELCCKWSIVTGDLWTLIEGETAGQTHVDIPVDTALSVFSHPIDVHYATTSMEGWPKLVVQVYHQDTFGRNELYGYGFAHIPTTPGSHELEIVTWRPMGSISDQLWSYFLGATVQLKNLDLIHSPADRFRLVTTTMGKVHVEVSVLFRNFAQYGIFS